jgi:hypothetical protein
MRYLALVMGGMIASLGAAAQAQFAKPAKDPVAVAVPVTNELTMRQGQDLYGYPGPRPGLYRLRNLHSGLCLTVMQPPPRAGIDPHPEAEYLAQQPCGDSPRQNLYVLPSFQGFYSVRTTVQVRLDPRAAAPGQVVNCATTARMVVLGAARIDVRTCDIQPGQTSWIYAAGPDQWVKLLPRDGGNFAISSDQDHCWTPREGSRGAGADMLRWNCHNGPDQVFTFEPTGPMPAGTESALLTATEWYPTAGGYRRIAGAWGIDLTGPVYSSFETINDNGDYCRKRCAELDHCKAWTWTAPDYVINSNDPPKCYWKSAPGEPISRGPQSLNKLRSGIIR